MDLKEFKAELETMKASLETAITEKAKSEIADQLTAFKASIAAIEEKADNAKGNTEVLSELGKQLEAMKATNAALTSGLEILSARVKSQGKENKTGSVKSFNEVLAETIEDNIDVIRSHKMGEKTLDLKVVGDMSMSVNFPAGATMFQDRRTGLIETPYNRIWLSDILPSGTSTGTSILYPKENGGEGAAAVWTDPTADKAQMDFDLTSQSAYFKWIAGYVIVAREMLDDVPFLQSYLQNKMLISLKTAENNFILNGTADTNPVQGLLDVATAYSGSYVNAVDEIIDAGWGQIVEDTNDFYNPTHAIMMPRDKVRIGLNKAEGSGEYDLPAGSVAFANGNLTIGGITTVGTTAIGAGNYLVFDRNATMFVRRMQPEFRIFEDATLAKKNKIMFRIEERATLATFNNAAIVKGELSFS